MKNDKNSLWTQHLFIDRVSNIKNLFLMFLLIQENVTSSDGLVPNWEEAEIAQLCEFRLYALKPMQGKNWKMRPTIKVNSEKAKYQNYLELVPRVQRKR